MGFSGRQHHVNWCRSKCPSTTTDVRAGATRSCRLDAPIREPAALSPTNQSGAISLIEDGGKQFHINNRGASDALVISDGGRSGQGLPWHRKHVRPG